MLRGAHSHEARVPVWHDDPVCSTPFVRSSLTVVQVRPASSERTIHQKEPTATGAAHGFRPEDFEAAAQLAAQIGVVFNDAVPVYVTRDPAAAGVSGLAALSAN
jgi:hypothetical protein